MIELSVDKESVKEDKGIVYLLFIWHDDEMLVKIGVTKRKIEDRIVEILVSYYKQYRIFPKLYPKRFKKTNKVFMKEAKLHRFYGSCRYEPEKPFSGSTELFKIDDIDLLLRVYADCIDGLDIETIDYSEVEGGDDDGAVCVQEQS